MSNNKQLLLLFTAIGLLSAATGIHDSVFNNFLEDTFHLTAHQRGILEFPRETPGFLVAFIAGLLALFSITTVSAIGTLVFAAGLAGLCLFGGTYGVMIAMMTLTSTGMHILQPMRSSLVLALSDETNRGKRLGDAGAAGNIGLVLGAGAVWLLISDTHPQYRAAFAAGALVLCVAALLFTMMHVPSLHQPRARFVIRKRFSLYYLLELLFGARKQIFITFGPWVLIKIYGLNADSVAGLIMTSAVIGILFKPLAGLAIDYFGERVIMIAEGIVFIFVCAGYGYALPITGDPRYALYLAGACYILDDMLFGLSTARTIYLSRITESPQELNSSLALGISINHIVSMTIPIMAGYIWDTFGYERLFLAGAVLAVTIACASSFTPKKKKM